MSRGWWFVAGAASGVYTLTKAKRTAHELTPDGIAARMSALTAGARVFADEVSTGMREREAELRADIQARHGEHRSIDSSAPRLLIASPSREGNEDGHR